MPLHVDRCVMASWHNWMREVSVLGELLGCALAGDPKGPLFRTIGRGKLGVMPVFWAVGPGPARAPPPMLCDDRASSGFFRVILTHLSEIFGLPLVRFWACRVRLRQGAESYAKPRTRFPWSLSSPLGPTYR